MEDPNQHTTRDESARFTREWDRAYTKFARVYDIAVRRLPVWKTWLRHALPHIEGPRVLEISFGTGWLLSEYAGRFETHGVDYNRKMVTIARENCARARSNAHLVRGNVEALPYPDASFDCLVNTMAFTGYPNGERALAEMKRVLRDDGKLVMIDVTYPPDRNRLGTWSARLWESSGDVLRDMPKAMGDAGFACADSSIGAWGSVRLYVARKADPTRIAGPVGPPTDAGHPVGHAKSPSVQSRSTTA